MSDHQNVHSIDTTSKVIINDWLAIREIMADIATTCKEKQETEVGSHENLMTLLSDIQFSDAFTGPFHPFIKKLLASYALICKLRLYLITTQDDNIKPHISEPINDFPPNINTDINVASLDKIQRQLDETARSQFQQWKEKAKEWQDQLILQLTVHEANLSELEIEAISTQETLSELLNQFTDLHLELPKIKDDKYKFTDYFKLKVILCLHSALSRQHKAHETNDIQIFIKKLKSDFKQIGQQEQGLIKAQGKEIDELMQF